MTWDDFEIALLLWLAFRSKDAGCYCNLFNCEHARARSAVIYEAATRIQVRELSRVLQ